jgi:hypothetical protein
VNANQIKAAAEEAIIGFRFDAADEGIEADTYNLIDWMKTNYRANMGAADYDRVTAAAIEILKAN